MAKAELTTVENFKIVTGMEAMDEELRAELEDELDDLDDDGGIDAKHIKIPSGGGKAFEVETDDPDDPGHEGSNRRDYFHASHERLLGAEIRRSRRGWQYQ